MIRKISALVTLATITAAANVATAGGTKMAVPSGTTSAALEPLSREANVIADVLTVDRSEYLLHLDGSAEDALSGQKLTPESVSEQAEASTVRIPFDQIALVYAREIPASAKSQSPAANYPVKSNYPTLAKIGAAEQGMDCGDLDREIARAGTIRWYARQQGAAPYTEHEARVQHGKNAAFDVGIGVLVAVAVVGAAGGGGAAVIGGGGGGSSVEYPVSSQELRWAVTAADRRELGLLQLKNQRNCAAVKSPDGAMTDLDIFSRIETTHELLGAHQISDSEQRDQQTQLLDQLDPPVSATRRVASATEFAAATTAANEKKGEPLGGPTLASYTRYVLVEAPHSGCAYPKFGWPLTGHPTQMGGPFDVRERALTWTREDSADAQSLQFKDIAELRRPESHYGFWFIPIQRTDGSCVFINVTNAGGRVMDQDRAVEESARSTMLARVSESSK
jgi:hypothetical protein